MAEEGYREQRRKSIIEAAAHVFSKKGYHNTRMEEIALAAGIGKATIYEYFGSKLHLFQEMLESSLQLYYETLNSGRSRDLPVKERIRILLEGHFQFCLDNKEMTRIIFWDNEVLDQELKEWSYKLRKEKEEQLQQIIQDGIDNGELAEVNPVLVTYMIGGILGSFWAPIVLEDWEVDPHTLAQEVVELIFNGIKSREREL